MNKKPKDPSVLRRKPLVAFFRWVHEFASEKGGQHTHSVEIEPQRVSTLGVFKLVHLHPLTADQYKELADLASKAGMFGFRERHPPTGGRTGSVVFRFNAKAQQLIKNAFEKVHGKNTEVDFGKEGNKKYMKSLVASYGKQ